jgi:hypothetical protein
LGVAVERRDSYVEAFEIRRQMPGEELREAAGGVTFLSCLHAFALSTTSVNIHNFCPPLPQNDQFFEHISKLRETNSVYHRNHTATMADTQDHDELIMQFLDLTGTSPGKVSLASPVEPLLIN